MNEKRRSFLFCLPKARTCRHCQPSWANHAPSFPSVSSSSTIIGHHEQRLLFLLSSVDCALFSCRLSWVCIIACCPVTRSHSNTTWSFSVLVKLARRSEQGPNQPVIYLHHSACLVQLPSLSLPAPFAYPPPTSRLLTSLLVLSLSKSNLPTYLRIQQRRANQTVLLHCYYHHHHHLASAWYDWVRIIPPSSRLHESLMPPGPRNIHILSHPFLE